VNHEASRDASGFFNSLLNLPNPDHEPTIAAFALVSGFDIHGPDFVRGLRRGGQDRRVGA